LSCLPAAHTRLRHWASGGILDRQFAALIAQGIAVWLGVQR